MARETDSDSPDPAPERQSLDAIEADLAASFLPIRFRAAHAAGRVQPQVSAVAFGEVAIARLRFGTDIHVTTGETVNFHVNIVLSGNARSRSDLGWELATPAGSGYLFSPGERADVQWSADFETVTVMLDAASIASELEGMLGHALSRQLRFDPLIDLSDPVAYWWREAVRMLVRHSGDAGPLQFPLVRRRLEQFLSGSLLMAQQHNYSSELEIPVGVHESRTVSQALQMINDRPDHPWTATELAAATGVSTRTLQAALTAATGKGPAAHLREARLSRAHDDLLHADGNRTTVAAIAHRWGFAHLGRFAATYRERYGVSPSETLQRSI